MYFFTHLFISKVLYQHFKERTELDPLAFAYGNIKPDLPSPSRNHHTLENCLSTVCQTYQRLREKELSPDEFSVSLGIMCHYLSDFFCYYHLEEELHNKKLQHFFYEIRQYFKLHHIRYKHRYKILWERIQPRNDLTLILHDLRNEYFSQPMDMKRDIDYALSAAVWACESIIRYLHETSQIAIEAELALNSFFALEGGNL
ncbi:MAG TPA: zinc dependent phospholipase C family protein [Mobilitalea sp.]|nr:zinc dependent phospholipase C family protein [Mobilitalea sp.]